MARVPSTEPVDPATLAFLATLAPTVVDTTMSLIRTLLGYLLNEKLAVVSKLVETTGDLLARPGSVQDYTNRLRISVVNLSRDVDREATG